ncbi:MAG: hemerythrin family protein [Nitrosomonadales bacterium]|nr:hemerythrin family protein [Nitrosomonadales bacterium]
MGLTWNKQLSVGNAVIDSDHKNLINIVNSVRNAIRSRDSFILSEAFVRFEDWLCIHFANEERIAHAVNFDFSGHRQEQQYALCELQHLRDELVAKGGIWSDGATEHFTGFLKNWLIDDHIVRLDMLMKPALQVRDYTFWPGWKDDETNHIAGHTANLYLQL